MEKCVKELFAQYKNLENAIASNFSEYLKTDEGQTLLLMAMESMVKTHKAEKLQNISKTLIGVANAKIKYETKEYILKISTELEPFDVIVLKRVYNSKTDYNAIKSYEDFYIDIVDKNEISKDEFYFIAKKLTDLSLLRISSVLDGFNDTYSTQYIVTHRSEEEKKPKIVVTQLGENILYYFKV